MAGADKNSVSFHRISTSTVFMYFLLHTVSSRPQLILRYTILEELPIGTVVADDVIDNVALRHGYSKETAQTLSLSIIDGWSHLISLGNGTMRNTLLVKERLDREMICPLTRSLSDEQDCVISVDVVIHPVKYFQMIRIEFILVDINDNSPVFSNPELHQSIPESAPLGTFIHLPVAVDLDRFPYSITSYHLESVQPDDHSFRLTWNMTSSARPFDQDDVRLELTRALDRETVARYHLTVRAYDGDSRGSQRSAVLQVVIDVSDVNDNSPAFELDSYDVTLPRDYVAGMVVARVIAKDADDGRNGVVRYKLSKRSQELAGNLFNIHHVTADVTLVRGFNERELLSYAEHKLVVIATDQGDNPLPTSVVVTIRIPEDLTRAGRNGLNDDISVRGRTTLLINVETLDGNNLTSHVLENNPAGTFLAHITAAINRAGSTPGDDVEEEHDDVTCYIFSDTCTVGGSTTSGDFSVQPLYGRVDFKLVASSPLDRESCAEYDVIVSCKAMSRMTSSAVVKVIVDDVDDNTPVFEKEIYEIQVKENNKVGDLIAIVSAHDEDILDQEQKIRVGRDSKQPKHPVKSPEMKTSRKQCDRNQTETNSRKGHGEKSSYSHRPHNQKFHSFVERHHLEPSTGQKSTKRVRRSKISKETPLRRSAVLYYQLDYEGSKYFTVNSRTGEIFAQISFDRETRSRYEFYVTVLTAYQETGLGNSAKYLPSEESLIKLSSNANSTARCLVRIIVLDEDDEKPQFLRSWYRFNVSETAGSGTEVGTVRAVDNDQVQHALFLYQLDIADGIDSTQFAIDPNSGVIYTRSQLDRESISHYTLKVKAVTTTTESGQDYDSALVFVKVLDSNDNPPLFVYPSPDKETLWRLAGDSGRDAVALIARDSDEGENARISFHLVSGSDDRNLFQVDEMSGILTWTDLSHHQRISSERNADIESSLNLTSRTMSSSKSTSKLSEISPQSYSLPHSQPHSSLPVSSFPSPSYSTQTNKSHCPLVVTIRVTDHPNTGQPLSTIGVLFVLPRGCNWSHASRALTSDVIVTSFDSGAETVTKFHILIIAGAVGVCVVLSILLGISVCLCRYCRKPTRSHVPHKEVESVHREVELVTKVKNGDDENGSDEEDDDEKREAFLILDKLCRDGDSEKPREIVLYVKDPAGLKAPEPVARFQLQAVGESRRSSRLYSSRRSRSRTESDESGLFRTDRDTDSGYLDVSSV